MFQPTSKLLSGQNLYATYCCILSTERIHGLCHGKVFSGYTRERCFPLFSLLWLLTSWTEGFFLAHRSGLQLWVSATYHQGLRVHGTVSLYVCVSVCVYVCVGVSSEQSNGLAWHPNNHCPLGPKQATLLHYAGTEAGKTNKPRAAKVPSLHVTASIIQCFLSLDNLKEMLGKKCYHRFGCHKTVMFVKLNLATDNIYITICYFFPVTGMLNSVVIVIIMQIWNAHRQHLHHSMLFLSNIAEVWLQHYGKRTDGTV